MYLSVETAKGAYMSTLSLSAGLGTDYYTSSKMNYGTFSDQIHNNFSQYVGISLNIPIFTRFSTRNNLRTAKLNKENQQLQVENIRAASGQAGVLMNITGCLTSIEGKKVSCR